MDVSRAIIVIVLSAFVLPSTCTAAWLTSFEAAKTQAAASRRPILVFFTGSDWCTDCQQLKSTILENPEFQTFAESRLILMEVDAQRYRPMAALQAEANRQLTRQFNVTTYPTLLLVDQTGKVIGNIQGAGNATEMVRVLDQVLVRVYGVSSVQKPARPREPATISAEPIRELPPFSGAATHPAPVYSNLILKAISGPVSRRFALINSETLSAGDSTRLKLGDRKLQLRCVEVREKSVVVRLEGESGSRELKLDPPVIESESSRSN